MDRIDAAFERLHVLAEEAAALPRTGAGIVHHGSRFTFAPNNHVRHVSFCGNAEPVLLQFGRDARLLAIAVGLLGSREMDQLINQAHYKRPGSAVTFDWHQDSSHRGIGSGGFTDINGRGSYVQILLAIDDSTADNGPLEFIPGSNKLGHLGADLSHRIDPARRVTPMLKRGDVVAFGPFTVHGSQANLSNKSRRVFINGFAFPGANHKDYQLPHSGERLITP
jgi:ectoine hydroxylase-related dioxygenase (phytanoyl-CoA dioxygenase family)